MWRLIHSLVLAVLLAAPLASVGAAEPASAGIRQLDDEVQEAKTDVLNIAAELNMLEAELLYPSGTRLTVSLAIARDEGVQLRAAEIRIDGELMAHHVYSLEELEALRKGGVQNLYTGNITRGKHELNVKVIAELANGSYFEAIESHAFSKDSDPRTLDITLDLAVRDGNGIRIGDR